jgi:hypothetical protein
MYDNLGYKNKVKINKEMNQVIIYVLAAIIFLIFINIL